MIKSFVFILNLLEYKGEEPIEIIPDHSFHRASLSQIKKIKECLFEYSANPLTKEIYEIKKEPISDKDDNDGLNLTRLPTENWRYWVISFEGANQKIPNLSLATSLLKKDLEFGFTVIAASIDGKEKKFVATQLPGDSAYSYYSADPFGFRDPTVITEDDLLKIGPIYELIDNIPDGNTHLNVALSRWKNLKSLPRNSDMLIIGLFSVIECIIAHAPYLVDSSDSLT